MNRKGAYEETLRGVERVKGAGLRAGCNVFLTKTNVAQFDEMLRALDAAGVDEASFEPAAYYPTRRGRRYAAVHPELDDLAPLADEVLRRTKLWRDRWADLGAYTEAAYVHDALAGRWPTAERSDDVRLVCRPNLDLHSGIAGAYGERHGNLRDAAAEALESALRAPRPTDDDLLLGRSEPRASDEIARDHGDPTGREVHFFHHSVRNRWLERAAAGA